MPIKKKKHRKSKVFGQFLQDNGTFMQQNFKKIRKNPRRSAQVLFLPRLESGPKAAVTVTGAA